MEIHNIAEQIAADRLASTRPQRLAVEIEQMPIEEGASILQLQRGHSD